MEKLLTVTLNDDMYGSYMQNFYIKIKQIIRLETNDNKLNEYRILAYKVLPSNKP